MGKISLIIAAIGLLVALLFGRFPGIKKDDDEALIDNEHDILWSVIGYALLAVGLGAAVFYYL